MMIFWIIAALGLLLALVVLAIPLMRKSVTVIDIDRNQQNIDIARERLSELHLAYEAGDIDQDTFDQQESEIERTLADEFGEEQYLEQAQGQKGLYAFVGIVFLLPLFALVFYYNVGTPQALQLGATPRPVMPQGHEESGMSSNMPSIDVMAERLAQKLKDNPENTEGWFLLGRTYMSLNRFAEAKNAFEQVMKKHPDVAEVLLALADAQAMTQNNSLAGRPAELVLRALELEPENITALWLGGMVAEDKGDFKTAVKRWKKARAALDSNPESQRELDTMIQLAEKNLAGSTPGGKPLNTLPQAPRIQDETTIVIPEPPQLADNKTSQETPNAKTTGSSIQVSVRIDEALKAKIDPNHSLFVFAKALTGPPMPLAVSRHKVSELPLNITLDDSMAMMPSMRISSFSEVRISAKISVSGNAMNQEGDILSNGKVIKTGRAQNVDLIFK